MLGTVQCYEPRWPRRGNWVGAGERGVTGEAAMNAAKRSESAGMILLVQMCIDAV